MSEGLPTVQGAMLAHCQVAALCLECDRIEDLDLEILAEWHANTPLIHLPLRCQGCGSRDFRIVVSGRGPEGSQPGWR